MTVTELVQLYAPMVGLMALCFWVGSLSQRVKDLEKRSDDDAPKGDRLTRLETGMEGVKEKLEALDRGQQGIQRQLGNLMMGKRGSAIGIAE